MKTAYLFLFACLVATCASTVAHGESPDGVHAAPPSSAKKDDASKSTKKEKSQDELSIEQRVGVEQDVKTGRVRLSFAADVKGASPIAARGATAPNAIIVSNDARYDLVVRVVAAPKGDPLLHRGTDATLAIHSPTLLFRSDFKTAVGKRYIFRLEGTVSGGTRQFFDIVADELKAREQPSGKVKSAQK